MDTVQRRTFLYFWEGAEPNSGLAPERYHVDGVYPQNDACLLYTSTPDDVLAFSYVGLTSQSVKVGAQTVINVTLKEDSQVLAETVVIGYGLSLIHI